MFTRKHRVLIILSGTIWLGVGIFLLSLGTHLFLSPHNNTNFSLISSLSIWIPNKHNLMLCVLCVCLLLGFLKGKFVLSRTVKRQVSRITSRPPSFKNLYSRGYIILILCMIALGMILRSLPIAPDTRGAVDIAIGMALINGAVQYFRHALFINPNASAQGASFETPPTSNDPRGSL